jgi:alpha-maltose-1-phosphate synthase
MHLMNAIPAIDPEMQIVLCAGTPEIGAGDGRWRHQGRGTGRAVLWVREMVSRPDVVQSQRLSEPAIP